VLYLAVAACPEKARKWRKGPWTAAFDGLVSEKEPEFHAKTATVKVLGAVLRGERATPLRND